MRWLVGLMLALGLALNLVGLWLWWLAALNGWRVTLLWGTLHEQYGEGVMLHVGVVLFIWAFWSVSK